MLIYFVVVGFENYLGESTALVFFYLLALALTLLSLTLQEDNYMTVASFIFGYFFIITAIFAGAVVAAKYYSEVHDDDS